jgi:hypothetical protein
MKFYKKPKKATAKSQMVVLTDIASGGHLALSAEVDH